MRSLLILAALAALLVPALAGARDGRPGYSPFLEAQQQGKQKGYGRFERGEREMRRGERGERGERDGPRYDRLTDDERRELHRDLDRADREIYRRKPPRQPAPPPDR